METKIEQFKIIGISIRTTNENNKAIGDIANLWNRFLSEKIIEKIPNEVSSEIYAVYTDYEGDYTKPYTTILGCKVENLYQIPKGMVGKEFAGGKYHQLIAKGNITKGTVIQEWIKIWNSDLDRAYTTDFEVYGEKAHNPENAEVEIFVAIQ
ncbi:MAG: effector binding domain-containing protein [Pseudomonadota bacterium]